MDWINAQENKPKEGQNVLIKIAIQQFIGGTHSVDEVVITGGIKDGDWFVGNDMLVWDHCFNLGVGDDDVIEWCSLDGITKAS